MSFKPIGMPCSFAARAVLGIAALGRARLCQRALGVEMEERMERGVEPRDAVEAGARELHGRERALGDERGRFGDRPEFAAAAHRASFGIS